MYRGIPACRIYLAGGKFFYHQHEDGISTQPHLDGLRQNVILLVSWLSGLAGLDISLKQTVWHKGLLVLNGLGFGI